LPWATHTHTQIRNRWDLGKRNHCLLFPFEPNSLQWPHKLAALRHTHIHAYSQTGRYSESQVRQSILKSFKSSSHSSIPISSPPLTLEWPLLRYLGSRQRIAATKGNNLEPIEGRGETWILIPIWLSVFLRNLAGREWERETERQLSPTLRLSSRGSTERIGRIREGGETEEQDEMGRIGRFFREEQRAAATEKSTIIPLRHQSAATNARGNLIATCSGWISLDQVNLGRAFVGRYICTYLRDLDGRSSERERESARKRISSRIHAQYWTTSRGFTWESCGFHFQI